MAAPHTARMPSSRAPLTLRIVRMAVRRIPAKASTAPRPTERISPEAMASRKG